MDLRYKIRLSYTGIIILLQVKQDQSYDNGDDKSFEVRPEKEYSWSRL